MILCYLQLCWMSLCWMSWAMSLQRSPDASTFPRFKWTCFVYIVFFINNLCLHMILLHSEPVFILAQYSSIMSCFKRSAWAICAWSRSYPQPSDQNKIFWQSWFNPKKIIASVSNPTMKNQRFRSQAILCNFHFKENISI